MPILPQTLHKSPSTTTTPGHNNHDEPMETLHIPLRPKRNTIHQTWQTALTWNKTPLELRTQHAINAIAIEYRIIQQRKPEREKRPHPAQDMETQLPNPKREKTRRKTRRSTPPPTKWICLQAYKIPHNLQETNLTQTKKRSRKKKVNTQQPHTKKHNNNQQTAPTTIPNQHGQKGNIEKQTWRHNKYMNNRSWTPSTKQWGAKTKN